MISECACKEDDTTTVEENSRSFDHRCFGRKDIENVIHEKNNLEKSAKDSVPVFLSSNDFQVTLTNAQKSKECPFQSQPQTYSSKSQVFKKLDVKDAASMISKEHRTSCKEIFSTETLHKNRKDLIEIQALRNQLQEREEKIESLERIIVFERQAFNSKIHRMQQELGAKLLEKEAENVRLASEKEKLACCIRKTLHKLQEKYLLSIQICKKHLQEKADKIETLENKIKKDKHLQKQEEQLLTSAVYELGMDIVNTKLIEILTRRPFG